MERNTEVPWPVHIEAWNSRRKRRHTTHGDMCVVISYFVCTHNILNARALHMCYLLDLVYLNMLEIASLACTLGTLCMLTVGFLFDTSIKYASNHHKPEFGLLLWVQCCLQLFLDRHVSCLSAASRRSACTVWLTETLCWSRVLRPVGG